MTALQIRIDGQIVETADGLSVSVERFNPIFDFSEIRGTKTQDFSLPICPTNQRIFGFYENPQMGYVGRDFLAEKYADGQVVERGYIALKEATSTDYVLMFTQNLGEIFGDYQDVLLTKMPFGSEPVPTNPSATVDFLTDKYCFPTVENSLFYGVNIQADWHGYMNEYANGQYNAHARVPMFFLRWIFNRIGELCDFEFEGTFWEDESRQRLILYNTFSLDDATEFVYQNHLPEISTRDLLKDLRKLFNVSLNFDVHARVLYMDVVQPIFGYETTLDWTDKAEPSHTRTPLIQNRIGLDWELDGGDEMMKVVPPDFQKYQSTTDGGTLMQLKTKFSTLEINATSGMAIAKQVGITPRFGQLNQKFTPRLLFWNGMIGGKPVATNSHDITRLAWHGDNNLVSNFWANYEEWRKVTFQIKKKINLTAADLAALDFQQKVHIYGVNYWIDTIKYTLPLTGASEVFLWKA